jgi:hypothetical protein
MRDSNTRRTKSSSKVLARAKDTPLAQSNRGESRWTLFAQGISNRYSMLQTHPPAIAMLLGRSAEFLQLVHRKTLRSVNLYPTINLSINNVLRPFYWLRESEGNVISDSTKVANLKSRDLASDNRALPIQPTEFTHRKPSRTRVVEATDELIEIARSRPSLVRALQRLETPDRLLISAERILQTREELMSVASRVRTRSSRVESNPRDRLTISTRGASLVLRKAGQNRDETDRAEVVDFRAPARQPQPIVDVHSLTEEVIKRIDSKTTAWRERLGRI